MRSSAIVGVIGLVVGVLLGAVCGVWLERRQGEKRTAAAVAVESARAGRVEAELTALRQRLEWTDLQLRLGRIAMVAERQDYGTAADLATGFFDDLAVVAARSKDDVNAPGALQRALAARDEVTAALAIADPAATRKLHELYLGFFEASP